MKERCGREWPQRSFGWSLGKIWRWDHNPKQLNKQQRGSHRRLGNAHGAREDPEAELPASEKRTVGSRGRLHHAARPVWTHNVWPAHKTGCHALGLKAVKTPVTGCESGQALSALFPIAGVRAANTAEENHSDYTSDYKRQKSEFQIFIATNVATTESKVCV